MHLEWQWTIWCKSRLAQVQALSGRVIKAVSQPFVMPRGEFIIGCSIGVVTTTGFSLEMDSLVEVADRALYLSKRRAGTPSILQLAMPRAPSPLSRPSVPFGKKRRSFMPCTTAAKCAPKCHGIFTTS